MKKIKEVLSTALLVIYGMITLFIIFFGKVLLSALILFIWPNMTLGIVLGILCLIGYYADFKLNKSQKKEGKQYIMGYFNKEELIKKVNEFKDEE